jgi:hypothetical protein
MTAVQPALTNDLQGNGTSVRWRQRLGEGELAHWTKQVRSLLSSSDQLLDAFERLNLENQTQAPPPTRRAAFDLIGAPEDITTPTVQDLLDALFDFQESILLELRACKAEKQLRAEEWKVRRAR